MKGYGAPMNVGIYARLSRDRDGTETATVRQEADCRALANGEGWDVVDVYVDSDLSGFDPKVSRPDFERMIDDLEGGVIQAVLVWKLDRLSRQPGQFESVVRACERTGARIVSINESADMTSPSGLAMMRVGMAFAAMESQNISLRVKRAKQEQAREGKPHGGGIRPFGLSLDRRSIIDVEAEAVRQAAEDVINGATLTSVANDWNERGLLTTKGNAWTVTAVRRLIAAPHVAGCRHYHGDAIPSDVIPAILDQVTWQQVKAIIEDPSRRMTGERVLRPLSGLVRCGRCGSAMRVKYRKDGRQPLYRCLKQPGTTGCGRMVVVAEPVEDVVLGAILDASESGRLVGMLEGRRNADTAKTHDDLSGLRVRRQQLVSDYHVDGLISRGEFLAAAGAIDDKIGTLEGALARHAGVSAASLLKPGESIESAWRERGFGWSREIARSLIDRVVIAPAPNRGSNRLDPSRVEVVWRGE
jgi:DNA invertase Pin-like site-specific DNA recombinase